MRFEILLLVLLISLGDRTRAVEIVGKRDVAYVENGAGSQSLDFYRSATGERLPVVVWIHGGGWTKGDKGGVAQKAKAFVEKGYVFVSINYRLLPEVPVPAMMADIAKAIRWIRDHAEEHRGNPDSIVVMGHSAGAHLAALLCTDLRYLDGERISPSCLKGCVPIDVSAYDIPKRIHDVADGISANFRAVFGPDEAVQRDLSPVTHIREGRGIPSFLILHVASRSDTREQAHWLRSAMIKAGFSARVYAAEGKTHGSIGADIGLKGDASSEEIWKFLQSVCSSQ